MKQISGIRHIQVETVLVQAWLQSRPLPAPVSSRVKERIFPARVGMAPPGDRRAGRLFPVAAHAEHGPDGQLVMPGFQHDRQAPALPWHSTASGWEREGVSERGQLRWRSGCGPPRSCSPCSRTGTATIPWPWRPRCASCGPSSTLDRASHGPPGIGPC